MQFFIKQNSEKGVSLLIVFFVMVIVVAVILSVSSLLYNEIKIVRNMSESVISFYAADTGIEKVLYYDRKEKNSQEDPRGMCNICNACRGSDCENCEVSGEDCDTNSCTDCQIGFTSKVGEDKPFKIEVDVHQECKISGGSISSYGFYEKVSRAIMINLSAKTTTGVPPAISCPDPNDPATCEETDCQPGGPNITFQAQVTQGQYAIQSVWAYVTGFGAEENENKCSPGTWTEDETCVYRELEMKEETDGLYKVNWNDGVLGVNYRTQIVVYDSEGNCVSLQADNILCSSGF